MIIHSLPCQFVGSARFLVFEKERGILLPTLHVGAAMANDNIMSYIRFASNFRNSMEPCN